MTIMIVDGDDEGSFAPMLAAVISDLREAPGDAVMGLYHYGDALEAGPLDALGTAVNQEYRTARQHHTGLAAFGQALRGAAERMRSGQALLETDFLWGITISMRYRIGTERGVGLVAVGLDGTVHRYTVQGQHPPVGSQITDGVTRLGADPIVAGLEAVLEAAVRRRDRNCRNAIAAMIDNIRTGDGSGDGHVAFGLWEHGDEITVKLLPGVTGVIDRHLADLGDVDTAMERAAAELGAAPPYGDTEGPVGTGLVSIDRTGPVPLIVANGVVGTRLHLVAWAFEHADPVDETCPWHELAPGDRRFVAALRALTTALTGPPA